MLNMAGQPLRVGFIGAGRVATALVQGMIASGRFEARNIMASHPHPSEKEAEAKEAKRFRLRSLGVTLTQDNLEVVEKSNLIFLAVRPPEIRKVASELATVITPDKLVASVALGITIRTLESLLPAKSRVIRVMPNTPTLVRAGVSGFAKGSNCADGDVETMSDILSTVGFAVEVTENLVDPLTGLSSCGPAYMLTALEAMADGGVKMGLSRSLATKLAAHALLGAAHLVLDTGRHPASLKDDIQSPQGSSIHAMHQLELSGFRGHIISAVQAATDRSKQTGVSIYKADDVDTASFR